MILFTILLIMILILAVVAITVISVGGSAFLVIFGDLIVCIAIIAFIMKHLIERKKRKKWEILRGLVFFADKTAPIMEK